MNVFGASRRKYKNAIHTYICTCITYFCKILVAPFNTTHIRTHSYKHV